MGYHGGERWGLPGDLLGASWGRPGVSEGFLGERWRQSENGKEPGKSTRLHQNEKMALFFWCFFESGEQHYHLGPKVEKGVSWEALGAPRDAFGTPWGKKTLPNTTDI